MIELHYHFKAPNKLKDLGIYEWLFTLQKETIRHYVLPDPDKGILPPIYDVDLKKK